MSLQDQPVLRFQTSSHPLSREERRAELLALAESGELSRLAKSMSEAVTSGLADSIDNLSDALNHSLRTNSLQWPSLGFPSFAGRPFGFAFLDEGEDVEEIRVETEYFGSWGF